jgi:hypothetical protein
VPEPGVPGNSVAPAGQAGDARRVAALEVWDDSPVPWWSQLRRRLRDDPGVWSLLERALGEHGMPILIVRDPARWPYPGR